MASMISDMILGGTNLRAEEDSILTLVTRPESNKKA
jgi:hypothetical protein